MYERLLKTIGNLVAPKVLIVGDFMLDVYVYGDAVRISPEAPVPVLNVTDTEYRCGGAASVAARQSSHESPDVPSAGGERAPNHDRCCQPAVR